MLHTPEESFRPSSRSDWRNWLKENHQRKQIKQETTL